MRLSVPSRRCVCGGTIGDPVKIFIFNFKMFWKIEVSDLRGRYHIRRVVLDKE